MVYANMALISNSPSLRQDYFGLVPFDELPPECKEFADEYEFRTFKGCDCLIPFDKATGFGNLSKLFKRGRSEKQMVERAMVTGRTQITIKLLESQGVDCTLREVDGRSPVAGTYAPKVLLFALAVQYHPDMATVAMKVASELFAGDSLKVAELALGIYAQDVENGKARDEEMENRLLAVVSEHQERQLALIHQHHNLQVAMLKDLAEKVTVSEKERAEAAKLQKELVQANKEHAAKVEDAQAQVTAIHKELKFQAKQHFQDELATERKADKDKFNLEQERDRFEAEAAKWKAAYQERRQELLDRYVDVANQFMDVGIKRKRDLDDGDDPRKVVQDVIDECRDILKKAMRY
eukprot:jgi/Mesvir1/7233/Mv19049-RA.1